jgi:hypothetical protein
MLAVARKAMVESTGPLKLARMKAVTGCGFARPGFAFAANTP